MLGDGLGWARARQATPGVQHIAVDLHAAGISVAFVVVTTVLMLVSLVSIGLVKDHHPKTKGLSSLLLGKAGPYSRRCHQILLDLVLAGSDPINSRVHDSPRFFCTPASVKYRYSVSTPATPAWSLSTVWPRVSSLWSGRFTGRVSESDTGYHANGPGIWVVRYPKHSKVSQSTKWPEKHCMIAIYKPSTPPR